MSIASPMQIGLKVADAVWVATAQLHRAHPHRNGFSVTEIVDAVRRESLTDGEEISIYTHANQHCVANRPPNQAKLRMLYELENGERRLHCPTDPSHQSRNGRFCPEPRNLPNDLLPLIDWYQGWCRKNAERARVEDPLLGLAGSGAGHWDKDAVAYIRRLREE